MKKDYYSNETNKAKEAFDREFAYNAAMREMEEYQQPFSSVQLGNPVMKEIIISNN